MGGEGDRQHPLETNDFEPHNPWDVRLLRLSKTRIVRYVPVMFWGAC